MFDNYPEIAKLVRDGCTSGHYPCEGITSWQLHKITDEPLDDVQTELIAGLIEDGYTSGYGWSLTVNK